MSNKSNFTTNFKVVSPKSPPIVGFFSDLPLPEGLTFTVVARESRLLGSIKSTNKQGQRINTARSYGTDRTNKEAIKSSILAHGVLLSAQPPYILDDGSLIDGFTRYEALEELGYNEWCFNVVEPKKGYTKEQVREEIGLGANDHPPSKAATRQDWLAAAKRYVQRFKVENDNMPDEHDVARWISSIPNSFSKTVISNIAEEAITADLTGETMVAADAADTLEWANKNVYLREGETVVTVNGSGSNTYFKRAFVDVLRATAAGQDPVLVGYLQNTPAEDAEETRADAYKVMEEYNRLFELAYERRRSLGKSFKLCDLRGFRAQVIGSEEADELV